MKYGVAVVSPTVAIRSVCVYHPPRPDGCGGGVSYITFLSLEGLGGAPKGEVPQVERVFGEIAFFEPHTYLLVWD